MVKIFKITKTPKRVGKITILMGNGDKETFEVWHKETSKIIGYCLNQINPHYWADYKGSMVGLGVMLRMINILKKSNGQVIWDTIPERVMKIAKREAILLRL